MAKFKASDFAAHLRDGFKDLSGVLFYGPDRGQSLENMASALSAALGAGDDGLSVAEMSGEEIKSDPSRLMDEALAIPFLGGRKIVKIKDASGDSSEAVRTLVKSPGSCPALLLVVADELAPGSKLRQLFETEPKLGSLPSYNDEGESLASLIRAALAKGGIRRVPDEVLLFLSSHLGENRATTRMELEKLSLYLAGRTQITLEDAEKCVLDSSALSVQDLPFAVAEGSAKKLARILPRLIAEGMQPVSLLRAVLYHFRTLYAMAAAVEGGRSIASVIADARPPIFFKLKPGYERQLRIWTTEKTIRAISRLNEAEILCKRGDLPQDVVLSQILFHLCSVAARK